jgi:thioesterase domain-containing protein
MLGYSLGGLIALETGRLLREAGEEVRFLGCVDAPFHQRYWPSALFIRATLRRARLHARDLLGQPPAQASRQLIERIRRLAGRVGGRFARHDSEANLAGLTVEEVNFAAMARWRPRGFEGEVVLFTAEEIDFGCDLAELWQPWLPGMRVRRVPGTHLELVQDPEGVRRLAHAVDEELIASRFPRLPVLVAATFRWSGAARLAVELNAAGCAVHAVGPRGSALHKVAAVERSYVLALLTPVASLRRAIESSSAEMIVAFDDRTRQAMHRIHASADPTTEAGSRLRRRLERSLGPSELYPSVYSRVAIMKIAAECGVRCPPTAAVESGGDIARWLDARPGPAVLKTDGSFGGRETRVIRTPAEARSAWRQLRRPPSIARGVKRLLVERDPWPLRARLTGYRPRLSIQAYVEGTPGNAAVACLDGELLGAVPAEVIRGNGPTGPSTVLRLVEHREMLASARTMANRLRMSGLAGLDFILENGRAHLIEVNPRATPTSHLISAEGTDLLGALRAAVGFAGPPPRMAAYPADPVVALFPQELRRDPAGEILKDAYHDVPWHAPDLIALALTDLRSPGSSDMRDRLAGLAGTPPRLTAPGAPG